MTHIRRRFDLMVASGELKPDHEQEEAVQVLNDLQEELEAPPSKRASFMKAFGKGKDKPIRGVYLWGAVGRGKSMLMDLFYDALTIPKKRRVHFHEFMLEVHARMKAAREQADRDAEDYDPIHVVARDIAADVKLFAFDEMVVNNSPDAMILSRLFTQLWERGVVVVATSNRPPDDLYKNGLNREHFLPFIDLLKDKCTVLSLNGPVDYRRDRLGSVDLWYTPNGEAATKAISQAFFQLTDYPPSDVEHVPSEDLDLGGGRILHVPKALKGVAVFSFKRLCGEPRGASDYLAIARRFHTVIVVGVPVMGPDQRNEAARFVTLIDALYEYHVKLLVSADAAPDKLYPAGDGAFEFERTVSRLEEMQSDDYLALGHGVE